MSNTAYQLGSIARLKQRLLPRELCQPERWRLAAYCFNGPWAGGDHYDVLPAPDGRLVLFLGDACGHEEPAAVTAAIARVVLHSCPQTSGRERLFFCPVLPGVIPPPQVILGHLNSVLAENTLDEQFMTAFLGILKTASGRLHFSSAGHPRPRWYRARRQAVEALADGAGLPLGLFKGERYSAAAVDLDVGDVLLIFSDGLIESRNARGEPFGLKRLDAALRELAPLGADAVKCGLMTDFNRFLAGKEPEDDMTFLVVERRG
ncbi:MAG: serine/threonine-protein phosphatase [Gemmataceae bacterium]|nr:serine/threonine-protein phosphatase [Gemmataceae bacterium]